jgi:hypothetical protein
MEEAVGGFCTRMGALIAQERDYEINQTQTEIANLSPKVSLNL